MNVNVRVFSLLLCILFLVSACGGDKKKQQAPAQVPTLGAAKVQKKTIPIWVPFLGKTKAVSSVDIRARVKGFLQQQYFQDGQTVHEGDALFLIEPDQYQVQLDMANAQLAKDQASLNYANSRAKRYEPLMERDYASRDTYDEYRAQAAEARAATMADRAQVRDAQLNLDYCSVTSPISGRISDAQVDVGNLVGASEMTVLATVVQLDPIHVVFNPSEKFASWIAETAKSGSGPRKVKVSLPGAQKVYTGHVDYFGNQVDPDTNTLRVRAKIENPSMRLLPGMYVTVNLYVDQASDTVLVPQQAVMEGQGGSFVYTVGDDGKIAREPIEAPHLYNGFSVVTKGLDGDETVLVEGLQKVRPGMEVKPRLMDFAVPMDDGVQQNAGASKDRQAAPAQDAASREIGSAGQQQPAAKAPGEPAENDGAGAASKGNASPEAAKTEAAN